MVGPARLADGRLVAEGDGRHQLDEGREGEAVFVSGEGPLAEPGVEGVGPEQVFEQARQPTAIGAAAAKARRSAGSGSIGASVRGGTGWGIGQDTESAKLTRIRFLESTGLIGRKTENATEHPAGRGGKTLRRNGFGSTHSV